jgi:ribulose-5-phosphate 4-epimerase/fuculose-1-phosphate aldolase
MARKTATAETQDTLDVAGDDVPTVRMERYGEGYQPPHTADVHVDEVENWSKHGWVTVGAD